MKLRSLISSFAALALAGTTVAVAAAPSQAGEKSHSAVDTKSLAAVLAADGKGFDRNPGDFDILDNAVRAVLTAKPKSPVGVLADGNVRLTAFAPTDDAFRKLAYDLTGTSYHRERRVFTTLAKTAGVDTIESVLLYHVVPGATITYRQAKKADGVKLETALEEATVKVRVRDGRVILVDADRDNRNARVIPALKNINKGNKQIAHGVSRVLRPTDL